MKTPTPRKKAGMCACGTLGNIRAHGTYVCQRCAELEGRLKYEKGVCGIQAPPTETYEDVKKAVDRFWVERGIDPTNVFLEDRI